MANKKEGIKRADVGRAIDEFVKRLARESESDGDFADDLSDFVVFLEGKIKRAQEKLASLEHRKYGEPDIELIEQFDSKNFSSLVLRADCITREDYEKLKEIFEEFRKKLRGQALREPDKG
ncbi:MAG: hypothetical protein AB1468_03850 [Candidatus Micrarchaeota archaeon]